jgi:nucleoside-diphosphate-sugar epimerase
VPSARILVTGAFGNIGRNVVSALIDHGDTPVCFDIRTPANRRTAKDFFACEVVWGDIREETSICPAVVGVDGVIHLAAIIPPHSEAKPELARSINVEGTKNLLQAIQRSAARKRIVFASSIAVHGIRPITAEALRPDAAYAPVDQYSKHKVECEEMIRSSDLAWTILRIAVCPPIKAAKGFGDVAASFELPPDEKIEICHPADVGLALSNAVANDRSIGKALLIGGGESCRHTAYELMTRYLEAAGIGQLPKTAYASTRTIPGGWVDTRESQALLSYQRHTLDDLLNELKRELGLTRLAARILAPLLRRQILKLSPYYNS